MQNRALFFFFFLERERERDKTVLTSLTKNAVNVV
jgi:hypothetical protein